MRSSQWFIVLTEVLRPYGQLSHPVANSSRPPVVCLSLVYWPYWSIFKLVGGFGLHSC